MKHITKMAGVAILASTIAHADGQLNIYNWSDYIAEDTIANFEAETGISVTYDMYDSNEVLEAKMMAGSSGYDLVVPTGDFLARGREAGVTARRMTSFFFGDSFPFALHVHSCLGSLDETNSAGSARLSCSSLSSKAHMYVNCSRSPDSIFAKSAPSAAFSTNIWLRAPAVIGTLSDRYSRSRALHSSNGSR